MSEIAASECASRRDRRAPGNRSSAFHNDCKFGRSGESPNTRLSTAPENVKKK